VLKCNVPLPVIVKPLAEGTGKGIEAASKITNRGALREVCRRLIDRYNQPALVERFLPGREFTVGILGTGAEAEVIGTLQVVLLADAESDVYSYANKEHCEEVLDCRLVRSADDRQVAAAERIALEAWRLVGGRDGGRVDLRCDEAGQPQIMEINPLAGLHPTHSDLPMLWTALERDYVELIGRIVESATFRIADCELRIGERHRQSAIRNPQFSP
jgi:D-alanine-D-alanine ligase